MANGIVMNSKPKECLIEIINGLKLIKSSFGKDKYFSRVSYKSIGDKFLEIKASKDMLNVFAYSSPTKYDELIRLEEVKLNGKNIKIGTKKPLFCFHFKKEQLTADMKLIKEGDGFPLGCVYKGKFLYIFFDINQMDGEKGNKTLINWFFKEIKAKHFKPPTRAEIRKEEAKTYGKWVNTISKKKIAEAEKELTTIDQRVIKAQEELTQNLRRKRELVLTLKYSEREGLGEKMVAKQFSSIKGNPYVDNLRTEDDFLIVTTKPLKMKSGKKKYNIGRYDIKMSLTGSIRIFSLKIGDETIHQHPHVDSGGSPCLGNIASPIAKYLANWDINIVVVMMLKLLMNYNKDSPYIKIGEFMKHFKNKE